MFSPMSVSITDLPTPRALVVEDEPAISEYLCQQLQELGYAVQQAQNYSVAMGVLSLDYAFDVAFIDLGLPDRSGLELISEVRSLQPWLPVVWATGYGHMVQSDTHHDQPAPVVLAKPYRRDTIIKALLELKSRRSLALEYS